MRISCLKILIILLLTASAAKAQDPSPRTLDSLWSQFCSLPPGDKKLNAISKYTYTLQNIDSITKYAKIGLELSHEYGHQHFEGDFNRFVGWTYAAKGQADSALIYYMRAAEIFSETNELQNLAFAYYGISEIMEVEQNLSGAIDYTLQMEQIGSQSGQDPIRALAYFRLGGIYLELKAFAEARQYLRMAADINTPGNNPMQLGNDYRVLAETFYSEYKKAGNLDSAIKYYKKAGELYEKSNDVFDLTYTYYQLCETCLKLAQSDTAQKQSHLDTIFSYISKAQDLSSQIGYYYYEPQLRAVYIKYLIEKGDLKTAEKLFRQLKQESITDPLILGNIYQTEALLLKARGQWEKAFELTNSLAISYKRNMLNLLDITTITNKTSENDFLHRQRQRQKEEEENLRKMEDQRLFSQKINKIIAAILAILVLSILVMLIQYIHNRRVYRQLKQQKDNIAGQNALLKGLNEEILQQKQQMETQTQEIKQQTRKLMHQHREIVDALESAEMIQRALMPDLDRLNSMFGDTMVYWKPFGIVSGDFYWTAEVLGHKLLAVADCTGHGAPGAMMSTLGISSLNEICSSIKRRGQMPTAAEILRQLRVMIVQRISRPATRYEDSINDGMDIALCIINPDGHGIQFAGAKRPLWLMREGKITEYRGSRITVGPDTLGEKIDFENHNIEIQKDDILYMFSDGITDQLGIRPDGKRKKFQSSQLKQVLESVSHENFDTQWLILNTRLHEWEGPERQQTDDIVLMGIRVN